LPHSVAVVDGDAVGRGAHVAFGAGDDGDAEMRLVRRQLAAGRPISERLDARLGFVDRLGQRPAGGAVLDLFRRAAFAQAEVPLVGVEMVVAAVDERRGGAVAELQKRGAACLGRPRRIEPGGAGADAADKAAAEQPRGVDLVRHLVEQDSAAQRSIELFGAAGPVQVVRVVEAVNEPELAKLAAGDDVAHQAHRRIEGVGVADDQMHLVTLDRREDDVALRERQSHRLFQDDMLAVRGGEHGMFGVVLVRRGDVDDGNGRVADQHPHVLISPCSCDRRRRPGAVPDADRRRP
jgi:hypothetical protein